MTLKLLKNLGLNFQFFKIIADTNFKYITPESGKYINKQIINDKYREFQKLLQEKVKDYPVSCNIIMFSELTKGIKRQYNKAYRDSLKLLDQNQLVDKRIMQKQRKRTKDHMGLRDKKEIDIISKRTIATYAEEGIIFDLLLKRNDFSKSIWLNFAEADERTISIINSLRKRKKIGNLPMLFM